MEKSILNKLANITVGQILTRVSGEEGKSGELTKILVPKAISEGGIIDENISREYIIKDKIDEKKFTKEKDVVLKLATPYEAVYIDEAHKNILVSSFCAILRAIGDVDPAYLCALVNSSFVREQLNAKIAGTTLSMVKISDLNLIEVPSVDDKKTKEIGKEYLISGKKRQILMKLANIEKEIMDNRILNVLQGE